MGTPLRSALGGLFQSFDILLSLSILLFPNLSLEYSFQRSAFREGPSCFKENTRNFVSMSLLQSLLWRSGVAWELAGKMEILLETLFSL